MAKKYCRWKEEEIKKLFSFVKTQTEKGASLSKAFELYSVITGRKPNSVRNYYYSELSFLLENNLEAKRLSNNLENHKKNNPQYFTKAEAESCVKSINNLVEQGNSVRKACLILSNGNVEEMVRLQNKYRSLTKNQKQTHTPLNQNQINSNIIAMPQKPKHLTESEINSLFLGILKLIKTSAKQEANAEIFNQTQSANQQLRQALVNLANKEKQLKTLQKNFELLKSENNEISEKLKKLRAMKAEKQSQENAKMKKLKTYTQGLKSKKHTTQVIGEK